MKVRIYFAPLLALCILIPLQGMKGIKKGEKFFKAGLTKLTPSLKQQLMPNRGISMAAVGNKTAALGNQKIMMPSSQNLFLNKKRLFSTIRTENEDGSSLIATVPDNLQEFEEAVLQQLSFAKENNNEALKGLRGEYGKERAEQEYNFWKLQLEQIEKEPTAFEKEVKEFYEPSYKHLKELYKDDTQKLQQLNDLYQSSIQKLLKSFHQTTQEYKDALSQKASKSSGKITGSTGNKRSYSTSKFFQGYAKNVKQDWQKKGFATQANQNRNEEQSQETQQLPWWKRWWKKLVGGATTAGGIGLAYNLFDEEEFWERYKKLSHSYDPEYWTERMRENYTLDGKQLDVVCKHGFTEGRCLQSEKSDGIYDTSVVGGSKLILNLKSKDISQGMLRLDPYAVLDMGHFNKPLSVLWIKEKAQVWNSNFENMTIGTLVLRADGRWGTKMNNCIFSNVSINHLKSQGGELIGCKFTNCTLANIYSNTSHTFPSNIFGSTFQNVTFEGESTFDGVLFADSKFENCTAPQKGGIKFQNCTFMNTSFKNSFKSANVTFINCEFRDTEGDEELHKGQK